ncbi:MAG: hypothetical protein LDL39_11240 [Magnetospirillum sp.]|nr:hypothetical protein [Magnetospirillum sp.]
MFSDSMMLGGGRKAAFSIAHSVRLDGVADYFSRTPTVPGNRKTWTFSAWVKRSSLGTQQILLITGINTNNYESIYFDADDSINLNISVNNVWVGRIKTQAVFRDTTSWGHLVVTKNVVSETPKIFWNGIEQETTVLTAFSNLDGYINAGYEHRIGSGVAAIASGVLSGYVTQPILADGQALPPSAFGETDPVTGSWQPKKVNISDYGTNGFHLDFADAANLGKDAANTSIVAMFEPSQANTDAGLSFSNNKRTVSYVNASSDGYFPVNMQMQAESKVHVEINVSELNAAGAGFGLCLRNAGVSPGYETTYFGFLQGLEWGIMGAKNGEAVAQLSASASATDRLTCEIDVAGQTVKVRQNGVLIADWTSVAMPDNPVLWGYTSNGTGTSRSGSATYNFGQSTFNDPVTNGFSGLLGGNDWNPVSLSSADVVSDTPANNFATINLVSAYSTDSGLSNGNLSFTGASALNLNDCEATIDFNTDDSWYWEVFINKSDAEALGNGSAIRLGVQTLDRSNSWTYTEVYAGSGLYNYRGYKYVLATNQWAPYAAAYTTNDTISVLWNGATKELSFWKNGVNQGVAFSGFTQDRLLPSFTVNNYPNDKITVNFGQRPFTFTPPTGYKTLCTANLPAPTIQSPAKHFDVVTYRGNADALGGIWSPVVTDVTTSAAVSYVVGRNGDYLYVYQANNIYSTQAAFTVWRKNADGTFTKTSTVTMPTGFSRGCVVLSSDANGGTGFYGYISNGDAIGRLVSFTFTHDGGGSIVGSNSIGYAVYPDGLTRLSGNLVAMNTGYSGGLHLCFVIDGNLNITTTNSVTGALGINGGWANDIHPLNSTSYLIVYKSSSTTKVSVVSYAGGSLTVMSTATVFDYLTTDTKIIKLDNGRFWIHDSTNDKTTVLEVNGNSVGVVVSQFSQNVFGALTIGMSWAYQSYDSWQKRGTDHWRIPVLHDASAVNPQSLVIIDLAIDATTGAATATPLGPVIAPATSRGAAWMGVWGSDLVASFANDLYFYPDAFGVDEWGEEVRTQTVGGLAFKPDLVWIKARSSALAHALYDSLRGEQKRLSSNATDIEASGDDGLTAFNDDGFRLGGLDVVNSANTDYVAWCWKAGGAAVANTDGTIPSQVSANPTAGFSIVSYAGNGLAGATVGHGLGAKPSLIIVKPRTGTINQEWDVYHAALGATKTLQLQNTDAAASYSNKWNDTDPDSAVFTLGNEGVMNTNGRDCITYCWAEVPGFSKFGSYTGNGSADGPFVHCGFRPAFVLIKRSSGSEDWSIHDSTRDIDNPIIRDLFPNTVDAELIPAPSSYAEIDFTASGFKLRNVNNRMNASGGTYIFAAFAEAPLGGKKTTPAKAR